MHRSTAKVHQACGDQAVVQGVQERITESGVAYGPSAGCIAHLAWTAAATSSRDRLWRCHWDHNIRIRLVQCVPINTILRTTNRPSSLAASAVSRAGRALLGASEAQRNNVPPRVLPEPKTGICDKRE